MLIFSRFVIRENVFVDKDLHTSTTTSGCCSRRECDQGGGSTPGYGISNCIVFGYHKGLTILDLSMEAASVMDVSPSGKNQRVVEGWSRLRPL